MDYRDSVECCGLRMVGHQSQNIIFHVRFSSLMRSFSLFANVEVASFSIFR